MSASKPTSCPAEESGVKAIQIAAFGNPKVPNVTCNDPRNRFQPLLYEESSQCNTRKAMGRGRKTGKPSPSGWIAMFRD